MISRYLTVILLSYAVLWCDGAGGNAELPENRPLERPDNPPAVQEPPFAQNDFYKGVSWVGGRRVMPDSALAEARDLGIEWLALTPFGWMENHSTPSVRLNRRARLWGESDQGLRTTARKARALGFQLMLKPHLWLTRPVASGWIGVINFDTEEEWQKWEADYRTFILHYAELAQSEDMAILLHSHRAVQSRSIPAAILEVAHRGNQDGLFRETDLCGELVPGLRCGRYLAQP